MNNLISDEKNQVKDLKDLVQDFCEVRDWDQFHNAKELAVALSIEVSELLELFRWKSHEAVDEMFEKEDKRERINEELADVLFFVLRIAQKYDIDLVTALKDKVKKNNEKYPVDKFKGSDKKYNEI